MKAMIAMSPQEFQNIALAWIGVATVVLTALSGLVFGLWAKYGTQILEIKERLNRQGDKIEANANNITTVALNSPTPQNSFEVPKKEQ